MDPKLYDRTRLIRIASHQADSATYAGPWTNSNFQVSLQNELQGVGGISAFSIESVGFPNVFPNIRDGYNTFLFRVTAPDADNINVSLQNYSIAWTDNATGQTHSFGLMSNRTTLQTVGDWNLVATTIFPTMPLLSSNAAGVLTFTMRVPITFVGDTWTKILGIPSSQIASRDGTVHGYPQGNQSVWQRIDIPSGFYDDEQLAAALQAAINATGLATVTVDFLTPKYINRKFRITSNVPISLTTILAPLDRTIYDNRDFLYHLGFSNKNQDLAPASVIVAEYLPNLSGETVVYLHSQQIAQQVKGYSGEGQPDYCICSIPINVGFGEMQHAFFNQYQGPQTVYNGDMTPTVFDITFKNVFGDFLDVGDNQQCYLTLKVWYRESTD